ncbi:formate dehydrogenase accessory sulfurtransferase FdhD [Zoogloea sp.]|uniref:formate dehydrogenase accessory sulfurtransferase FdhD n=1 Tax=Zoogloea sp. TaxID=49181 RepID=UPI0025D4EC6E|nr:formate dehydrogenase accessory sulfurtransferase FdhD [Zoogloea sp.]MCK6392780.1 formate dehydrogenase accessory sulfurtransferase FdhD [Zoogloea sp.]
MPHAPASSCPSAPLHAADADAPLPAHRPLPVYRVDGTQTHAGIDEVIEEVPVALVFNGISHAVLLATPTDLEDLALGFSLSEGILAERSELYDLECFAGPQGIELRLEIASSRFASLKARRRNLAGRTGCGLCGVESLDALARPLAPVPPHPALDTAAVATALAELPGWQGLRQLTGAVHAAAWVDADGHIRALREDVGRHNALDKLLGHLARTGTDTQSGFALVSSRASYEMVQKVAVRGIGCLVAVSAPTALAVKLATEAGLTLAGFARGERLVVYSHPAGLGLAAT